MFINTLNEERTVLSLLHYTAAAVGQIVLHSDGPRPLPSCLQTFIPDSTVVLRMSQEEGPTLQS